MKRPRGISTFSAERLPSCLFLGGWVEQVLGLMSEGPRLIVIAREWESVRRGGENEACIKKIRGRKGRKKQRSAEDAEKKGTRRCRFSGGGSGSGFCRDPL